jgi:hypothetical protein
VRPIVQSMRSILTEHKGSRAIRVRRRGAEAELLLTTREAAQLPDQLEQVYMLLAVIDYP